MNVSIVLPTYNEYKNIVDLIDAIEVEASSLVTQLQIVVVDDNSPDGTGEVAENLKKKFLQMLRIS